jgi:Uma2 family endonuclease
MSAILTPPQAGMPTSVLLTAEEFAKRHAGQRVELIEGQVKELPVPTPKHGRICLLIARFLDEAAERQDLGRAMTNDSFVKTKSNPDVVRGAHVSYYSYERLPKGVIPEGLLPVSPDLVVEVRLRKDNWSAIFGKVAEYLGAGVRAVIVLDPVSESASVYRQEEEQQIFHNGDELAVPDVLPGFSVCVRRLFA